MVDLLIGEKQEGEAKKAIQACNDYLRMGAGRSLAKLIEFYTQNTAESPPVRTLKTVKKWSSQYGWQARANAYDSEIERQKTAELEARRKEAMLTGLALDYERVLKLKHLADTLAGEIWDNDGEFIRDAVWLPDVKSIGSGEYAERVDIVRFNKAILDEFREILNDLAKETGGRRESPGTQDNPLFNVEMTLDEWKARQAKTGQAVADTLADFNDGEDAQDE